MQSFIDLCHHRRILIFPATAAFILIAFFALTLPTTHAATTDCATQTEIPQSECEALVALYNSTGGSNWTYPSIEGAAKTVWNTNQTPCSWAGVTCEAGHVREIATEMSNMRGTLPPEIGNFPSLKSLVISNNVDFNAFTWNEISGTIPSEIGNLTALEHLSINGGVLTGGIPAQIGNLSALKHLSLFSLQLSGSIPPEIGNLAALEHLELWGNRLSGTFPPEITDLTRLKVLSLGGNKFTGDISPQIGGLANLEELYLDSNGFSSIPPEIGNLVKLKRLSLMQNQFSGGIPAVIWNLRDLELLDLQGNQLSGSIPSEIGNLTQLNVLRLDRNQLSGSIPSEIGQLTKLTNLEVTQNQLSGSIPSEIGNLIHLETFKLSSNQLSGSIPPQIGNLTNLRELWLSSNPISGSIPPEIGNLTNLEWLDLSWNQLSGSIPAEIGNLAKLRFMYITNTQLSGSLPSEFGNLSSLTNLSLSSNQLSGSIPSEFGNLSSLQSANLGMNQLSGSIPAQIGNLNNLGVLMLRGNQLSGSIPPEIGNLLNLSGLELNNNQLSGSIPSQLFSLPKLSVLDVSYNEMSGSIPAQIGDLTTLHILNLSHNQFSGSIPSEIGSLIELRSLNLRSNQLSGSIPPEIGNLINLFELYLSNNQLSGEIPPELSALTNLVRTDLSLNQLGGEIPEQIGDMSNLAELNLSANQLSGEVPTALTNLTNLSVLDIRWNMLTTSDPSVVAFLNAKNPDWFNDQTLPPVNVITGRTEAGHFAVAWNSITNTQNKGYYEVGYTTTPGGPYLIAGRTTDKTITHFELTQLPANAVYHIAIRTLTSQHVNNPFPLISRWSAEVTVYPPIPDDFRWLPAGGPIVFTDVLQSAVQWTPVTDAASYDLYVGYGTLDTNLSLVFYEQGLPASTYCTEAICAVPLVDINPLLINGKYTAFLKPSNTDWSGPGIFDLAAEPPAPPIIMPITGTMTIQPLITWSLPGDAALATYFQVYITPADDLSNPAVFQWVGRDEACGTWESITCTWTPGVSLPAGKAYHVYMQSWGAGGFSEGGEFGIGWSMDMFNVGGPTPALPDAATFDYAVNGEQVTITFPDDPNATAVYFFIGNVGINPLVINFMAELTDAQLGCNGTTCTFTPTLDSPLTPGTYTVYVQPKSSGGPRGDGYVNLGWFDAGTFNAP